MKLTKEAKEGLEFGVSEVERYLAAGYTPSTALDLTGITSMEETTYFLEYLRESGHGDLLARLTK